MFVFANIRDFVKLFTVNDKQTSLWFCLTNKPTMSNVTYEHV